MWDAFTLIKRDNDKKRVSYDYENKFLNNWIYLAESDAKAERKRNKEDRIRCDTNLTNDVTPDEKSQPQDGDKKID